MPEPKLSDLDRLITFEARGTVKDPRTNTVKKGNWAAIADGEVWAQVQDVMPSRGENLADEINVAKRPARIRIRYRPDLSSDMRILFEERVLQIVSGPAEIYGRRKWLELMAEEYSSAEDAA